MSYISRLFLDLVLSVDFSNFILSIIDDFFINLFAHIVFYLFDYMYA